MPTCKLIIQDEVNCKIENLSLDARKKLMREFKMEIPGAKFMPSVRLGRWDGCASFFSIGGQTYINLLPEILPILEDYDYDIQIHDQRSPTPKFSFTKISNDSYSHLTWPVGHRLEGEPIILNDHQVEVINSLLENPGSLAKASTGSGKTIVTAAVSHSVQSYGRTIVIVPNKSLVTQTEDDYILLGLDVGVYYGDRKEYNKKHTICTWQSLNNIMKSGELGEFMHDVIAVIVDECHGVKENQLKEMLTGPFANIPLRWGLTGTIPKEKYAATALKVSLGEVVVTVAAVDLQEQGHLSKCNVNVKQLVDYGECKNYQQELAYLVTNQARISYLAKMIAEIKQSGNTLVLIDRIATGELLSAAFEDIGVEHSFVSGSTSQKKRKEEYVNLRYNDGTVLIATYGVAAVGISIDRIFNLVMIEPGKSFVRVIQSIGRGLRRAQDKDHVEIYDITSTMKFSKRHLTARKNFYAESEYPYNITKIDWKE